MKSKFSKRIYLDYAASTPVDAAVFRAMEPYFLERYGNAGSLHSFGQEAMTGVDHARETIARAIGADFREVIFTGSATEANNLVLRGAVRNFWWNFFNVHNRKATKNFIPHIIITAIEHESILETARDMEKRGAARFTVVPVQNNGIVDVHVIQKALESATILVSVMFANNEIGVIQPIAEIAGIIREFKTCTINPSGYALNPLFHTDAVQAFQYLDCDVKKLGVDLMTLSAHKVYGPKGVGVLYLRSGGSNKKFLNPSGYTLNPIITGGGQEFGMRSGTEHVPAIVGFGKAVALVAKNREKVFQQTNELKNYFWQELLKINNNIQINGLNEPYLFPKTSQPIGMVQPFQNKKSAGDWRGQSERAAGRAKRFEKTDMVSYHTLPNILNVYFPNHTSQDLLIKLDMAGIAVSSGAACSVRSSKPSHVLKALGLPLPRIMRSLRFSFGKYTTKTEIVEALKRMKMIFAKK